MKSSILTEITAYKSTNGRSVCEPVSWPRVAMQLLGWVAPSAAQERALKIFLTPPAAPSGSR
jgi:hypothetical protein